MDVYGFFALGKWKILWCYDAEQKAGNVLSKAEAPLDIRISERLLL